MNAKNEFIIMLAAVVVVITSTFIIIRKEQVRIEGERQATEQAQVKTVQTATAEELMMDLNSLKDDNGAADLKEIESQEKGL